ncbi:MAG: hypothetical protein GY803_11045 [Chloroflexi bacterium]|nr:hypothetical protein [Chloroflexota bacterium]
MSNKLYRMFASELRRVLLLRIFTVTKFRNKRKGKNVSHHTLNYEQGYRLTPHRQITLDAVCAIGRHATANEIYERIHLQGRSVLPKNEIWDADTREINADIKKNQRHQR